MTTARMPLLIAASRTKRIIPTRGRRNDARPFYHARRDDQYGARLVCLLLSAMGFYMWPHIFGATFTAKSGNTLRRNAVVMPLYTISLAFIFFAGFAAKLVVPGLKDGDLSLLVLVQRTFPPAFLGLVGGAGALTAMVPTAIIILTGATLFAKNVYRPVFAPGMSDQRVTALARGTVVALSLISLYFAIYSSKTLVALLLLGYAGVSQFFPGVIFGLYWRRITAFGVAAGLVTGITAAAFLVLTKRDPFLGCNAGFVALVANFAITVLVSLMTPRRKREWDAFAG